MITIIIVGIALVVLIVLMTSLMYMSAKSEKKEHELFKKNLKDRGINIDDNNITEN